LLVALSYRASNVSNSTPRGIDDSPSARDVHGQLYYAINASISQSMCNLCHKSLYELSGTWDRNPGPEHPADRLPGLRYEALKFEDDEE
jgi:hypothetical protein